MNAELVNQNIIIGILYALIIEIEISNRIQNIIYKYTL